MKIAIGVVLGFLAGFIAHLLIERNSSTQRHWKAIATWNSFVTNQSNYKPDPVTGLSVAAPGVDLKGSLGALVAAGELRHWDVVLPNIPNTREVAQHVWTFSHTHKEIVHISSSPSYPWLTPAGTQPVHLNIWFREADQQVVRKLLQELEEKFAKK
jgi:hypothetical protein